MKKTTILKARPNTKINIQAILFITIVIFVILCPGCSTYRDLHLSHMEKFQELVQAKYPSAKVFCKYEYASHVYLTVERESFDEEAAYTILGILQSIVREDSFVEDLFDFYGTQLEEEPNWKNGWRPTIRLYLDAEGYSRYQFSARATKEVYNSGYDPDSYTWDGYSTWYGMEYVDHVPRDISPEEIEEAIERYG